MTHFREVALQVVVEKGNAAEEKKEKLVKKLVVAKEKEKQDVVENQGNAVLNFINKITIYFNMKFSDMLFTLLILLAFVGMYVFSVVSVGLKNIKKNWILML